MKALKLLLGFIFLFSLFFYSSELFAKDFRINGYPDNYYENSGIVIIKDVSKPWYFKLDWFNAAACSRIFYKVNEGKPIFLVELAGPYPPTPAPIEIPNLKSGDVVVFLVKTLYGSCNGVYSTNQRYFKVEKRGKNLYYFQFEDAAGYDMRYNDGAFYFGQGIKPNKYIQIKKYKAYKTNEGIVFDGEIEVKGSGFVNASIEIRDNRWRVYKNIDLSFRADRTGIYPIHYVLKGYLPAPMYTSFLKVSFKGEKDNRVRTLKGCIDFVEELCGNSECCGTDYNSNDFGSSEYHEGMFKGKVYLIPEGSNRLPDFKRLKPVGTIYTDVLNITPRDFKAGFPGITNRYEWFAIDYKGTIYIKRPKYYKFSLLSDDGAKLIIDGKVVIDNDGIHPPIEKEGGIYLSRGYHTIEVQYFQGPRYQVALVLYIIENGRKKVFNIRNFLP